MKEYRLKKKNLAVLARVKGPDNLGTKATLTIKPEPIGLEKFKPRQTKTGLSVKVTRGGGTERIPHAFLQKVKGGKTQAFVRTRVIPAVAKKYVYRPAKKSPFRSKRGGELPINRLLADPASEVVRPQAEEIGNKAGQEASVAIMVRIERLLDLG